MNTTFWGPSGWEFLHTLTFIYPESPSINDKVKMKNMMSLLCFILPCKYCRLSFTKYMKSLPIEKYLESRTLMIHWLYKIHNKINKKLRIQGFCKHSNPNILDVIKKYESISDNINKILDSHNHSHKESKSNKTENKTENKNKIQNVINYICNMGKEFLGSIVFNYQGYFTNCHTGIEKNKIVTVYNSFFNSIIPLIYSYISKFIKNENNNISRVKYTIEKYNISKFNIKNILIQNEPYTKLVKWFYNCDDLCNLKKIYKSEEEYENYFKKHIVMSCDNPNSSVSSISNGNLKHGKTIKSCRKDLSKLRTIKK